MSSVLKLTQYMQPQDLNIDCWYVETYTRHTYKTQIQATGIWKKNIYDKPTRHKFLQVAGMWKHTQHNYKT